jgi:hypothetical protein
MAGLRKYGGVGAVNALSEVAIFIRDVETWPDAFLCDDADGMSFVSSGEIVHAAVYGKSVHAAARRAGRVLLVGLGVAGGVERVASVEIVREVA